MEEILLLQMIVMKVMFVLEVQIQLLRLPYYFTIPHLFQSFDWDAPDNAKCPPGHICATGTKTPEPCPVGQYQNEEQQTTCIDCPEGLKPNS